LVGSTIPELQRIVQQNRDTTRRLRALWTLHAIGASQTQVIIRSDRPVRQAQPFPPRGTGLPAAPLLSALLHDGDQNIRWWAIQLLCEGKDLNAADLREFTRLARSDPSPMVRLALASAMQRLPIAKRWGVMQELLAHADDAADQNLPLMLWYAVEPMVPADPARALQLAKNSQVPLVREFIARRIAEEQK
jgi:hypothetical protein